MKNSTYLKFKRPIDFAIAIIALVVLSPLILILALCVMYFQGLPVLFTQKRGGYMGSTFSLYKFRSMTNERDSEGNLLPDNMRLNRFGKFVRNYSLDELPGLLNVLKGDISLVGPRPFLADYLELYDAEQARRHDVKPGLTGWAQVNGRNSLGWPEKFKFDLWYVDNFSFATDVKILLLTVVKLIKRDEIASDGEVTGSRFLGNATNVDNLKS